MKASEVLRRYKDGRRDFGGESLRGQSFQGMNLAGADFSEADIRGANFTNAYLNGAKFSGAKAGLQKRWAVFLVVASWLLSAIAGVGSLWIGALVALIFDPSNIEDFIAGTVSIIILAVFFIVIIRKGLAVGFGAVTVAVAVTGAVAIAGAGAIAGTVAVAITGAGAVAVAVAGARAIVGAVAVAVAGAVAFTGAVARAEAIVGAGAIAVILLSNYLSLRALSGDERDAWIRVIVIAFAATGGTSFRGADLTDADFTAAKLKSTDFRRANLTRTRWLNASKLDRARPGTSYLQYAQVRQWLIGEGKDRNFEGQDLRGVNLQSANLTDANFLCTNLSRASLQDANLSRANLSQTQLHCADLTGAALTGAHIKNWGITTTTKLNRVKCDYVFMRFPTQDDPNPHRKPDDWNKEFAEGEFVDFITPMVLTLDLYHNRVDDPRLIAIAWQKLVQENPEAQLELVSIEKRGKSKDKLLLKAETSPQAEHSVLHSEYFTNLQHLESLPPEAKQALLRERGEMIRILAGLLSTKQGSPEVSVNNHQTQKGDKNMAGDRKIKMGDGNYIENHNESIGRDKIGEVKGDIINECCPT